MRFSGFRWVTGGPGRVPGVPIVGRGNCRAFTSPKSSLAWGFCFAQNPWPEPGLTKVSWGRVDWCGSAGPDPNQVGER